VKILITGANGMVGSYAKEVFGGDELILTDLPEHDVRDKEVVFDLFKRTKPQTVLHLAAETDVDRCELHPEEAYRSNVEAVENVAQACKDHKAVLIYVSTGFVFSGKGRREHTELDIPSPANVYGRTKLDAENLIKSLLSEFFIFRADWMIGGGPGKDKKLVGKIIKKCLAGEDIEAVDDMFSTPTFAKDFLSAINEFIPGKKYGLYHLANKDLCSRYEMALEIAALLGSRVKVSPVPSSRFPLPAPRAQSTGIKNYLLEQMGYDLMPRWQESLKEYVKEWGRRPLAGDRRP